MGMRYRIVADTINTQYAIAYVKERWLQAISDTSAQAGALGYHGTTGQGMPLSEVFAGTDKRYGYNRTDTTTHELLEMLDNP
jgi:hypothetical protein